MTQHPIEPQTVEPRIESRRNFLKSSSLLMATGSVVPALASPAEPKLNLNELRVGLIGCGSRGVSAALQILQTQGPIRIVALADAFEHRIAGAHRTLKSNAPASPSPSRFAGLDAFQRLIECDLDVVLLAAPPAFRADHFQACVDAGKHVFVERPIASDPLGVQRMLDINIHALQKRLTVHVGLQRRHLLRYQSLVAKIHEGTIGDIVMARILANAGAPPTRPRNPDQSELTYQIENWRHFGWLGGDPFAEQMSQHLDVIQWALGSLPTEAQGQGGKQTHALGDVFDHHFVEYTFDRGIKVSAQCRRMDGCWNQVGEWIYGTEGSVDFAAGRIIDRQGRVVFEESTKQDGYQLEMQNFIASIRSGKGTNELGWGAEATQSALLGCMASYTGRRLRSEDWKRTPHSWIENLPMQLHASAPVLPDAAGNYGVPIPGQTITKKA